MFKMKSFLVLLLSLCCILACSKKIEKVIEETYQNGDPKLVKYYKIDGEIRKVVKEIAYYPNNQVRYKGEFADGKRHGKWIYYYESGNKWSEGYYNAGERDGQGLTWHENGQLYIEGYYNNGKRVREWKFWSKEGKLDKEINYE